MTRTSSRLTALALSATLLLAACSSGSGGGGGSAEVSDEGKPYAEAFAANLMRDDEGFGLDEDRADCVGGHVVNIIGVDKLKEAGVEPEDLGAGDDLTGDIDLDEKQATAVYDSFGTCKVDLREAMMENFAQDEDMTPEMKKCFENALTEDVLRQVLILGLTGEDESPEAMAVMAPIMGCVFMGLGESDFGGED